MEEFSLKEKKELFVSGLNGTSLVEIFAIVGGLPFMNLLKVFVLCWCPVVLVQNHFYRFLVDFTVLVVPTILIVTELSAYVCTLMAALIGLEMYALKVLSAKKSMLTEARSKISVESEKLLAKCRESSLEEDFASENSKNFRKTNLQEINISELNSTDVLSTNLPFLKWFRSIISIVTCICILAVDFHIFPRRLAKTELFGTGLMDVGVGFYVVSNALVCREARIGQTQSNVSVRHKHNSLHLSALLFQLVSSWPIVLLGLIRLISVKSLGYQEHVSEYGVHWNFFFTLAFVKGLASIVLFFMNSKHCLIASILIGLSYQCALSSKYINGTAMLTSDDRNGFLMQNKEGLASCIGFLSLYFAGVHLGSFLFKPRSNLHDWLVTSAKLLITSFMLWLLLFYCQTEVQLISRRLSNVSYIIWLLALTTFLISVAIALDIMAYYFISKGYLPLHSKPDNWLTQPNIEALKKTDFSPSSPSLCVLCAVNRNQLLYFLTSNLLTGIINSLIDTMAVGSIASLSILCFYKFLVLLFLWYLHIRQITFKFW